jgi:ankyrin repeat protein
MVRFSKSPAATEIREIFKIDEFVETKGQGFTLVHRIVTGLSPYLSLEDVLKSDDKIVFSVDSEERSALYYAAEAGDQDIVKLLIRYGAEVDRPDKWGISPLMTATWFGHTDCVDVLLNADVNVDVDRRNVYGDTPIFFSAQAGHEQCAKLLLQHCAKIDIPVPYDLGSLLHTVAYYGHADMVDIFIDHGADTEQRDNNGRTPIELALFWGFGKTGFKLDKVARRLCERGAILNSMDGFECQSHGTKACYCGEFIPELLVIQERRAKKLP